MNTDQFATTSHRKSELPDFARYRTTGSGGTPEVFNPYHDRFLKGLSKATT